MTRYRSYQEIDKKKWDNCVNKSKNALPYGYTWYLDAITKNWGGVVMNDYEAVWPLPWNAKYGLRYVYQPYFMQQSPIYASTELSQKNRDDFVAAIPKKFRLIELSVNMELNHFLAQRKENLVLKLNNKYTELQNNYSKNLKRSLKKAAKNNLQITALTPQAHVDFLKQNVSEKIPELTLGDYSRLLKLGKEALQKEKGFIVACKKNNEILATCFLLHNQDRIINIAPASAPAGRNANAMHFLLDHIIQKFANSGQILDFEGSAIPSIARFFKSFGAEREYYWQIKKNQLPWYLKKPLSVYKKMKF